MRSLMVLIIIGFLLTIFGLLYAQSQTPIYSTGAKYQLFQGTYSWISNYDDIVLEKTEVFKINTETGEVWIFNSVRQEDGQYLDFWTPIDGKPYGPKVK